jgi:hypothetical protein
VPPSGRYDGPSLLSQVLAWVGIVAGVVFIVAVIFFSGFFLGGHARVITVTTATAMAWSTRVAPAE